MESAYVLRSFHHSVGTTSRLKSVSELPGICSVNNAAISNLTKFPIKGSLNGSNLASSSNKNSRLILSCGKTSETTVIAKSEDSQQKVQVQRKPLPTDTFPKGFEALITEVCDSTEVAELKLKVGGFEMHLTRKIEAPIVHAPVVSPLPSLPPSASKPAVSAFPMNSSSEKISPFMNVDVEKSRKLAALEATGANGFILVSSPTVGSFRRARTLKGKKQPPACKEGDVIKVGQTVGFLDQFGTELAVKMLLVMVIHLLLSCHNFAVSTEVSFGNSFQSS
ncbi:hypothetical protein HAX54_027342 [Datura stramonium]|uniref:Biotin carboxyl carrier protein n=1 Tax=Datura stramonium TaxID=4076 RepID=A0ABS8V2M5_DATST|nr:hypothetical protein [Datura stramonium]